MRNTYSRRIVDVLRNTSELPPTLAFLAILGLGLLLAMVDLDVHFPPLLWALLFTLIVASGTIVGHLGQGIASERGAAGPAPLDHSRDLTVK